MIVFVSVFVCVWRNYFCIGICVCMAWLFLCRHLCVCDVIVFVSEFVCVWRNCFCIGICVYDVILFVSVFVCILRDCFCIGICVCMAWLFLYRHLCVYDVIVFVSVFVCVWRDCFCSGICVCMTWSFLYRYLYGNDTIVFVSMCEPKRQCTGLAWLFWVNIYTGILSGCLSLQVDTPALKFELKPYVYSRAMANDVSPQQRPVNQRPIFHTMQPVIMSNGAVMQQVSLAVRFSFSATLLHTFLS